LTVASFVECFKAEYMFTEYKSLSSLFYVSLTCSTLLYYHLRVLLFTYKTAAKFIACLCLFQRNAKHYSDCSSSSLILFRFHYTSTLRGQRMLSGFSKLRQCLLQLDKTPFDSDVYFRRWSF